ncbi:hypothetical protein [Sphingobium yanoikuyae]|uniref:hypothetical protein n=1 Tax=Sphingobium yanoikuyae TaxID=13690 RepID=UPI0026EE3870|nr:hypothetical protein [Sphingobium yanoikuyae]
MSQPENPSAFPACNEANVNGTMGMTLRDWFAGQFLSRGSAQDDEPLDVPYGYTDADCVEAMRKHWSGIAKAAYIAADAMLAERSKPVTVPAETLQHVAYFDEGQFHWMSGIAPRDCELFAKAKGGAA